jgi:Pyruvate/2-oxoacid:ferredoxin oxidoreductase delta subunit
MIPVNERHCPQDHPCPAVRYCPEGAIIQDDVFAAPRIDYERCTGCGTCTGVCRVFAEVAEPVGVH